MNIYIIYTKTRNNLSKLDGNKFNSKIRVKILYVQCGHFKSYSSFNLYYFFLNKNLNIFLISFT